MYVIASIPYIHPVYSARGWNPHPLDHEPSALTNRPGVLNLLELAYPPNQNFTTLHTPKSELYPICVLTNEKFYPFVPPCKLQSVFVFLWRKPCKLLAYPRLRTAAIDHGYSPHLKFYNNFFSDVLQAQLHLAMLLHAKSCDLKEVDHFVSFN